MGDHVAQTSGILKMAIVRHQHADSAAWFDSCILDELAQRARPVDQFVKRGRAGRWHGLAVA